MTIAWIFLNIGVPIIPIILAWAVAWVQSGLSNFPWRIGSVDGQICFIPISIGAATMYDIFQYVVGPGTKHIDNSDLILVIMACVVSLVFPSALFMFAISVQRHADDVRNRMAAAVLIATGASLAFLIYVRVSSGLDA